MKLFITFYLIESTVKGTIPTVQSDDLATPVTISIVKEKLTQLLRAFGYNNTTLHSRASIVAQRVHFLSFLIRKV